MEAQVNDSEHEADAAGPRSLSNRSNSKNCKETFVKLDVVAQKRSPVIPSGNKEVVAAWNLSSPGHILKTKDADSKTRDITGQNSPSSMVPVSAKADVFACIQSPPGHILNAEDADSNRHDIRGQGSPKSLLAVSAKVDGLSSIQTSLGLSQKRDNSVIRNKKV